MQIVNAHAAQAARLYRSHGDEKRAAGPSAPTARRTDPLGLIDTGRPAESAKGLVAGSVADGVSFEAMPAAAVHATRSSIPLYTRGADKIEVEVALRGLTIDLTA